MLVLFAGCVGALGLMSLLAKRTLMGVLTGAYFLFLGASMVFVAVGAPEGAQIESHLVAAVVTFISVTVLVSGYALGVRLFFLKRRIYLSDLRQLKH